MKINKLISITLISAIFMTIFALMFCNFNVNAETTETTLKIYVTDEDGKPIPDATISVYKDGRYKEFVADGITDENGMVNIEVPSGFTYVIEGESKDGKLFSQIKVFVEEGYARNTLINLILKPLDIVEKGITAGNNFFYMVIAFAGLMAVIIIYVILKSRGTI